jgi:hypothetical protein
VKLRSLDKSRFADEIRMFLSLYNQAFQSHWGFVPLSEAEVVRISSELKHLIVPELTTVAEVDGKPVGCVFALPDYNPRIKKIDGRLFPTGFIRLLWNRRAIPRLRIIAANPRVEVGAAGSGVLLGDREQPTVVENGGAWWCDSYKNLSPV